MKVGSANVNNTELVLNQEDIWVSSIEAIGGS